MHHHKHFKALSVNAGLGALGFALFLIIILSLYAYIGEC